MRGTVRPVGGSSSSSVSSLVSSEKEAAIERGPRRALLPHGPFENQQQQQQQLHQQHRSSHPITTNANSPPIGSGKSGIVERNSSSNSNKKNDQNGRKDEILRLHDEDERDGERGGGGIVGYSNSRDEIDNDNDDDIAVDEDNDGDDDDEDWNARESLWNQLEAKLAKPEVEHVKRMIGPVVGRTEELHTEIAALISILKDYRESSGDKIKALSWKRRLTENPQRKFVQTEMILLAQALRKRSLEANVSCTPESVLTAAKEKKVYEYVLEGGDGAIVAPAVRPSSSRGSRPSSQDSIRSAPQVATAGREDRVDIRRPHSAREASSSVDRRSRSMVVAQVTQSERLKLDEIESLVSILREAFVEEEQLLLQDVAHLHLCLEDEHEFVGRVEAEPPSIDEMLNVNEKFRQQLLLNPVTPDKSRRSKVVVESKRVGGGGGAAADILVLDNDNNSNRKKKSGFAAHLDVGDDDMIADHDDLDDDEESGMRLFSHQKKKVDSLKSRELSSPIQGRLRPRQAERITADSVVFCDPMDEGNAPMSNDSASDNNNSNHLVISSEFVRPNAKDVSISPAKSVSPPAPSLSSIRPSSKSSSTGSAVNTSSLASSSSSAAAAGGGGGLSLSSSLARKTTKPDAQNEKESTNVSSISAPLSSSSSSSSSAAAAITHVANTIRKKRVVVSKAGDAPPVTLVKAKSPQQ